jgi:hypothetical protein
MLAVTETPIFQSMAEAVWSQAEREDFAVFISAHPLAGEVIPQTAGLRKLRWSRFMSRPSSTICPRTF